MNTILFYFFCSCITTIEFKLLLIVRNNCYFVRHSVNKLTKKTKTKKNKKKKQANEQTENKRFTWSL